MPDEASPPCNAHGFGSADDIELGEDAVEVRFHGCLADLEGAADRPVSIAAG